MSTRRSARGAEARRPRSRDRPAGRAGMPTLSPITVCSYQAALSGPSVRRTMSGSSMPSGTASRRASPSHSNTRSSGRACSITSPNNSALTARAATANAIPDGVRVLSSSTRKRPLRSRTRSKPITVAARSETMPSISGSRYSAPSRTRAGITPSVTILRSPYTSARSAFSARARWARPRSSSAHSAASTIRGIGSSTKSCLASPLPKTTSCSRTNRDAVSSARDGSGSTAERTPSYPGRGDPSGSKPSSKKFPGS